MPQIPCETVVIINEDKHDCLLLSGLVVFGLYSPAV
jgi:hypothetical protein